MLGSVSGLFEVSLRCMAHHPPLYTSPNKFPIAFSHEDIFFSIYIYIYTEIHEKTQFATGCELVFSNGNAGCCF